MKTIVHAMSSIAIVNACAVLQQGCKDASKFILIVYPKLKELVQDSVHM